MTEHSTPPPPPSVAVRRVRRRRDDRRIAGVASGIADYFDVDPTLVRLGFVVFALMGGSGVLFYLIAWLVIPTADEPAPEVPRATGGDDGAVPFTIFPMV